MSEELTELIMARDDARIVFIRTRSTRNAAAAYYDSVVTEGPAVTQPAWDAYSVTQSEMDGAGDFFNLASANVIEHILPGH